MVRPPSRRAARGFDRVIGFDMGGTSTDVSALRRRVRARVRDPGRRRARARADDGIHTVAAGGGSILAFDGARFRVGPESAGANPGPACYRRGGPLTVTDCQRDARQDPAGVLPARVRRRAATKPLDARGRRGDASPRSPARSRRRPAATLAPEAVAAGFVDIAVGNMANAIKKISVARGYDVTRYTLQCFGGAGGQHACLVADALGMERVFIHPLAGVLSAYGMGLADQTVMRQAALEQPLDAARTPTSTARSTALADDAARASSTRRASRATRIDVHRRVHLRYEGTDSALVVRVRRRAPGCRRAFEAAYRQRFAFLMRERAPDRRGGLGRGRRRAARRPTEARHALVEPRAGTGRGDACACSATAAGTTRRSSTATQARPGQTHRRPGDRRREQRDDDRRARLDRPRHARSTT